MAAYPVPGRWLLTHKKQKQAPQGTPVGLAFLPSGPREFDAQGPGETRRRVAAFVAIFIAVFWDKSQKADGKTIKYAKANSQKMTEMFLKFG